MSALHKTKARGRCQGWTAAAHPSAAPQTALPRKPHFFPHFIKTQRSIMFSSWKTKCKEGRKCCSRARTSNGAQTLPLSSSCGHFKVPSQGNICLRWLGPGHVGGQKYLVLNVTVPASSGHVTPSGDTRHRGPWPSCAMGTQPPGEKVLEGLVGSNP